MEWLVEISHHVWNPYSLFASVSLSKYFVISLYFVYFSAACELIGSFLSNYPIGTVSSLKNIWPCASCCITGPFFKQMIDAGYAISVTGF